MAIYEPAEDSYLMLNYLKKILPKLVEKNPDLKFLEMGCGSGINLQAALETGVKKENIFGADVNFEAVKHCKELGFDCFQSDLFGNLAQNEQFDLIIFNPPYLPQDRREPTDSRIETTGGRKGNEVSIKFLEQAREFLKENGRILLITSSLTEEIDFEKLGFKAKKVSEEKLFFEILVLWELTKK